jgi:hypothetical protein
MKLEFRQGDVGIDKIKSIPKEAKKQKKDRVILAYGEVTGHCHEVAVEDLDKIELFMIGEKMYLKVNEDGVRVTHQEHSTAILDKGNYEVIHQREYHPEKIRNVRD